MARRDRGTEYGYLLFGGGLNGASLASAPPSPSFINQPSCMGENSAYGGIKAPSGSLESITVSNGATGPRKETHVNVMSKIEVKKLMSISKAI